MVKLSIIILSFNTRKTTQSCLEHLLRSLKNIKAFNSQIIVVENGSDDGSVNMLYEVKQTYKKAGLDFDLILNKKNLGFTKGNNQGFSIAKGEYILYLNSDVLVTEVSFENLLEYLDANSKVGVLTVEVNLAEGGIDKASHRGFPTVWNAVCYFLGLEKLIGKNNGILARIFGGYHLTHLDFNSIHEIDSPTGAFFLTRKDIVVKLRGFDERFFMYGEDLDLAYRIKEEGYKVIYYPKYKVTHLKRMSGLMHENYQTRAVTKRYFYEAMKIFYKKHYENKYPWIVTKLVYLFIDLKSKIA